MGKRLPKLAVWKFTSCDGCQLSLLDLEDELLAIADRLTIAYFREATRAEVRGPYDLSLVEVGEHSGTTGADQKNSPEFEISRNHRHLRHFRGHPGPA